MLALNGSRVHDCIPVNESLPPFKQPKRSKLIIYFSGGAVMGLVIAETYWFNAAYFGYPPVLGYAIIGSLGIAITCGLLAAKFGGKFWQAIESLLPLIP